MGEAEPLTKAAILLLGGLGIRRTARRALGELISRDNHAGLAPAAQFVMEGMAAAELQQLQI